MVQTNLKSDNFCGYNSAAAPFFWTMDPVQNNIQYNIGEPGVFTGVGLHTPALVIRESNMLSDRGNYLTSCTPPRPPLPKNSIHSLQDRNTELNNIKEEFQNNQEESVNYSNIISKANGAQETQKVDSSFLIPNITRGKKSAMDYTATDWKGGFSASDPGMIFHDPHDLTTVIERMWLERGGLDSNMLIKDSYEDYVTKHPGPINGLGKQQMATCKKVRKPYDIKYPFGMPTDFKTGKEIFGIESVPFDAVDVTSMGIASPQLEQGISVPFSADTSAPPFNYFAMYNNGGCNKISFLKDSGPCKTH